MLSRPGRGPGSTPRIDEALALARALRSPAHFHVRPRSDALELTEDGRERLHALAEGRDGPWSGARDREEWVHRALCALHLHRRDEHYLVRDGAVEIIDPSTGRRMPGRSWERGLQQLVERREGCALTPEHETTTRISYQQLFRRYLRLAGTTGTAREVAGELGRVYGMQTVVVRPRRPERRAFRGVHTFDCAARKWEFAVQRIQAMTRSGRPVLVGTCSVAASEELAGRLSRLGVAHQVLNARQDAEEAAVVARAGLAGTVTVATDMAGRGTDIQLGPGVEGRGGLHVIATEGAPSRRLDRQLFGRCGRQGEPGSFELVQSLEDDRLVRGAPAGLLRRLGALAGPDGRLPWGLGRALLWCGQRAEERRHARVRRQLIALQEDLDGLLGFAGLPE